MTYMKYTPELLKEVAARCRSIAEVLRQLGIPANGGSHAHISRKLKALGIDTSHFTGSVHNRGGTSHNRKPPEQVLVQLPADRNRTPGKRLRRAMLTFGIAERCSWCDLGTTWNGKPLSLHVDHINGDFLDNRPDNVRFLCPNCHSQTETHSGRKRRIMGRTLPPPPPGAETQAPADLSRQQIIGVMIRFNNGELSTAQVAEQIGCSVNHVFTMRRRLAEEGALDPRIRQQIRDNQREVVIAFALANPEKGYKAISAALREPEHGRMIIGTDRIRAILAEIGYNTIAARRIAAAAHRQASGDRLHSGQAEVAER